MKCLNMFCVYQKDGKCMLDTIELDVTGACQSCIYPDIPTEILENAKEETRKKLAEAEEENE